MCSSDLGYTLLNVDNAYTIAPSVQHNLPYDTLKDFVRVTQYATTAPVLVVHPSLPVKNVKELIALAKAKPDQLNYGSSGNGAMNHLTGALFTMMTKPESGFAQ